MPSSNWTFLHSSNIVILGAKFERIVSVAVSALGAQTDENAKIIVIKRKILFFFLPFTLKNLL